MSGWTVSSGSGGTVGGYPGQEEDTDNCDCTLRLISFSVMDSDSEQFYHMRTNIVQMGGYNGRLKIYLT